MKMTMHIDEDLLKTVMDDYGFDSKTEAVEMALREMNRKARYREFVKNGLGLTEEEMANAVEPGYDPKALNVTCYPFDAEVTGNETSKVAEEPKRYGV